MSLSARKLRTISNVPLSVCPAAKARCEAAWMAGPSAIGSVKGIPNSIISAPACGRPARIRAEISRSGSPAVTKATKAFSLAALRRAKSASMRLVTGFLGSVGFAGALMIKAPHSNARPRRTHPYRRVRTYSSPINDRRANLRQFYRHEPAHGSAQAPE